MGERERNTVMDEKLSPERAVRLLRAKAAELENRFITVLSEHRGGGINEDVAYLTADVALVATLLADFMDYMKGASITWNRGITQEALDSHFPPPLPAVTE